VYRANYIDTNENANLILPNFMLLNFFGDNNGKHKVR